MSRKLTIKKGLDIRIAGGLGDAAAVDAPQSSTYGIIPDDFLGFVPKPSVKEGDKVKVGDPLLHALVAVLGALAAVDTAHGHERVEIAPWARCAACAISTRS